MQNSVPDTVKLNTRQKSDFAYRLIAGFVLVNLFVFFMVGLSLYNSRLHYERLTESLTQNMAKSLEATVNSMFEKIDIGLFSVAHETERELSDRGIQRDELNTHIQLQHGQLPELDGLRVSDAEGNVLYGTSLPPGKPASISDRDYFHQLRNNPKSGFIISKLLQGRLTGKWNIILARRINHPDGSFAGVVIGNLEVSHFDKYFSQLDIGRRGAIGIRDIDMSLIALHPKGKEPGSQIGSQVVSQKTRDMIRLNPETGTYKTVFARDNMERTVTYRKVAKYPFYIFATRAPSDYLVSWKREMAISMTMLAIFTVATIISLRMFLKSRAAELSNAEAIRTSEEMRLLSNTDGLLHIANRRHFDETLEKEWQRAIRHKQWLSLLIIDVDHFKLYNDYYGHLEGDECLKQVAGAIGSSVRRAADMLARYGGEEFAVILPDTDAENAVRAAAGIHRALHEAGIAHATSPVSGHVTVSIGVASMVPIVDSSPTILLKSADDALYAAKRQGRNRTCHAGETAVQM